DPAGRRRAPPPPGRGASRTKLTARQGEPRTLAHRVMPPIPKRSGRGTAPTRRQNGTARAPRSREPTAADRRARPRPHFFPSTASFRDLARRNFTTRLAGILMGSPVCGLRPIRALRLARTSRPKFGTTKTFFASLVASVKSWSITSPICFLVRPVFWDRCVMMADFVMDFAMFSRRLGYESERQSPREWPQSSPDQGRILLKHRAILNGLFMKAWRSGAGEGTGTGPTLRASGTSRSAPRHPRRGPAASPPHPPRRRRPSRARTRYCAERGSVRRRGSAGAARRAARAGHNRRRRRWRWTR